MTQCFDGFPSLFRDYLQGRRTPVMRTLSIWEIIVVLGVECSLIHAHVHTTHAYLHTHRETHSHSHTLSLSLTHTHLHKHTDNTHALTHEPRASAIETPPSQVSTWRPSTSASSLDLALESAVGTLNFGGPGHREMVVCCFCFCFFNRPYQCRTNGASLFLERHRIEGSK